MTGSDLPIMRVLKLTTENAGFNIVSSVQLRFQRITCPTGAQFFPKFFSAMLVYLFVYLYRYVTAHV